MTQSTLSDVGRLPKLKMVFTDTRNGNNYSVLDGMSLRPDSNGYPDICDHAGLVCDTADIA